MTRLPHNSAPYTAPSCSWCARAIPKAIRDWGDLVRDGVSVITPNPKTSGGARWNYLAAWAWARRQPGGDDATARDFMAALLRNVPVLDTGARGSTTTFAQRGHGRRAARLGERGASWPSKEFGADQFDIVVPSLSDPGRAPVAVVDRNVDRRGTRAVAEAYLRFLYTPEAQAHRGAAPSTARATPARWPRPREPLPPLDLVTIDEDFGGWATAQRDAFRRWRLLRPHLRRPR